MKTLLCLLIFVSANLYAQKPQSVLNDSNHNQPAAFYYLALGDSYTIGEQVASTENFPNQVARLMRLEFPTFKDPRIIAKTGWTTTELNAGISKEAGLVALRNTYDFVSLLIGVNDQFRGFPLGSYRTSFESLLKQAIQFAGNKPDHVIVLSIPDWAQTPFGENYDRNAVAVQIDAYNKVNKEIAEKYGVYYLDITPWTREGLLHPELITTDGLHPSGKEYERWSKKIAAFFTSKI